MSVDEHLNQGTGEKQYRRRDLRNGLASRMGLGESTYRAREYGPSRRSRFRDRRDARPPPPTHQRVRFLNIPLDVSDYEIDDLLKDLPKPLYSKFYDHEDSRSAVFEFEDHSILDKCVELYNGLELHGAKITVEIFEQQGRFADSTRTNRSTDHVEKEAGFKTGRPRGKARATKKEKPPQPTLEDLDAELDAYMNGN
ncbi:AER449Wp [Eremothecium gossypii ATCC 10895]|uniref:RNA annealing protein YRA2 n=1 Tax=Eremothecium gossypii (strain ATCC 10895 / CBS 109.51 / FGSC 9923 / NRRL Y-1056) TaxID=284811 RepID=YRA2_EREGS|nr:AER449Wp [Eremothecium gossypii ATCC 10895]Q755R9.2 RecName: Full=RNA annealing protein YRA2 [Eremothecium gossypii ATCC 10895]AAS53128.2 AER449Wp [Eremothecium gossypii ATCC 10895]